MIVLIDNFDSFTYNVYDLLLQCGLDCRLYRNNAITVSQLAKMNPRGIVLSPGPGRPGDYPLLKEMISHFSQEKKPVLGVCLGHQAIGEFFGASLQKAPLPVHGKISRIRHSGHAMYSHIPEKLEVTRYHSLLLDKLEGTALECTAFTEDRLVMSVAHKNLPFWGIQYHPEAILTQFGMQIIRNWAGMLI